jgi:hypothetical protein
MLHLQLHRGKAVPLPRTLQESVLRTVHEMHQNELKRVPIQVLQTL